MRAVFVNVILVVIGSLVGVLLHKKMSEQYEKIVFSAAGVIALSIGIGMVLASKNILIFALSLMLGGILGTFIGIEDAVERFGNFLKRRLSVRETDGNFTLGFLTASVLFCSGAMSIVGSFQAGTVQNFDLIYTKSIMDGFIAVLMASVQGIGVAFSAISILLYQGALTLAASSIEPYVSDVMLAEITGVGGAILIMIGFNLLGITKIKTGNFLPAIFIAVLFVILIPYLSLLKIF